MARVELSQDEMLEVLEDRFYIAARAFKAATDAVEYRIRANTASMILDAYIDLGGLEEVTTWESGRENYRCPDVGSAII